MYNKIKNIYKNRKNKKERDLKLKEIKHIKKTTRGNIISVILKSSFRDDFIKYCFKYKIDENISFYLEIEMYKNSNCQEKKRLSGLIYDKYFQIDSEQQINLYGDVRHKIDIYDGDNKYNDALEHVKGMLSERAKDFVNLLENDYK